LSIISPRVAKTFRYGKVQLGEELSNIDQFCELSICSIEITQREDGAVMG
jgi:hypothetical protein